MELSIITAVTNIADTVIGLEASVNTKDFQEEEDLYFRAFHLEVSTREVDLLVPRLISKLSTIEEAQD